MKYPLLRYVFLLLLGIASSLVNAQYIGGTDNDAGNSITELNDKYVLVGQTRSFGSGSEDAIILYVNSNFTTEKIIEWGGEHHDIATKTISTYDNNIIVSIDSWDAPGIRTDIALLKYSEAGDLLWTSYFGSTSNDHVFGLTETKDKGILIAGMNRDGGPLGSISLIKTDNNGNQLWEKIYDTPNKDIGMDVVELEDSSLIILANTSSFLGKITNSSEYFTNDPSRAMIIKTDQFGNEIWRQIYGGNTHRFGNSMVYNTNYGLFSLGSIMTDSNSFDMILKKYDISNGNVIWSKKYGGLGYEYGNSLDIDAQGNLLLTGTSSSFTADQSPSIYIIITDSLGNVTLSNTYGESGSHYGKQGKFLANGQIGILGTGINQENKKDIYFISINYNGDITNQASSEIDRTDCEYFRLYPNPARVSNTVEIKVGDSSQNTISNFLMYDIHGAEIMKFDFEGNKKTIDLQKDIKPGLYFYKVSNKYCTYLRKVVIN